ncbi:MAG: type I DNA topoisomerase, partial [Prevotellaceae bacterium]|nr:type I DNA topoisomerase [Prevotellaceae bacterium]
MQSNLVIVESPAKAKTIEKFLGKDFKVMSSYGHIRDLKSKEISINENSMSPEYEIPKEKAKLVQDLKVAAKAADTIWLASDEDREGEAISWHLCEVLGLDKETTNRIVFHEITKNAILEAIQNPRHLNMDLVYAQQARRVLDRIVGFKLSPILWKKIKPSLSAGRVQSVAVRLLVEKEREIQNFTPVAYYRVTGLFALGDTEIKAELANRLTAEQAVAFLEKCKDATFTIGNIQQKPVKHYPAPPFTTSTLQQEASRKLGMTVKQTMMVAQHLYESGKITYMRNDSVNLSTLCLSASKQVITELYGSDYSHPRQFQTSSKGAQEAHEAIRPTYMTDAEIEGSNQEKKLYKLIWKRTIASQMTEAELEKTTVNIKVSNCNEEFIANGEIIKFDGFLKVYRESSDEEEGEDNQSIFPAMSVGDNLLRTEIVAKERYTQPPSRYTEASLVHKLEELGIGRPSTYAPTITTIQQREYVVRCDKKG